MRGHSIAGAVKATVHMARMLWESKDPDAEIGIVVLKPRTDKPCCPRENGLVMEVCVTRMGEDAIEEKTGQVMISKATPVELELYMLRDGNEIDGVTVHPLTSHLDFDEAVRREAEYLCGMYM